MMDLYLINIGSAAELARELGFILAKAEIYQARSLRLANFSAAKTRTTPYDAYVWQMIALCGITLRFLSSAPLLTWPL